MHAMLPAQITAAVGTTVGTTRREVELPLASLGKLTLVYYRFQD